MFAQRGAMKHLFLTRLAAVAALVVILPFAAFAQQANVDIYDKIDDAFMTKSPESVRILLESNRNSSQYPAIEEYVLKKSRGLLISNQLELIQDMTMAIIDNNLDCTDAVNLYIIVERAIDKRDASLESERAQAAADAQYVASVSEEQKEKAKKSYSSMANETTGEAVYLNANASKYYSPVTWNAMLLVGDLGIITDNGLDMKIGLGAQGGLFFRDDRFSVGLNVYADDLLIAFTPENKNNGVIDLIPAISYVPVSEDLFLRTGFSLQQNEGVSFFSPVIGIGMTHAMSALNTASWFVDYYPAHLAFMYNLAFCGGAGANMSFGLSRVGSNVLSLTVGVRENLMVTKKGDVKSRTRINLGFGVGCNE